MSGGAKPHARTWSAANIGDLVLGRILLDLPEIARGIAGQIAEGQDEAA